MLDQNTMRFNMPGGFKTSLIETHLFMAVLVILSVTQTTQYQVHTTKVSSSFNLMPEDFFRF